jgi:hypothetical protein
MIGRLGFTMPMLVAGILEREHEIARLASIVQAIERELQRGQR